MCVYLALDLASHPPMKSGFQRSQHRSPLPTSHNLIIEASSNSSYFAGHKDPHARGCACTEYLKCYCPLCNKKFVPFIKRYAHHLGTKWSQSSRTAEHIAESLYVQLFVNIRVLTKSCVHIMNWKNPDYMSSFEDPYRFSEHFAHLNSIFNIQPSYCEIIKAIYLWFDHFW